MNTMMAREIAAQSDILAAGRADLAIRADAVAPAAGRILAGGCGDSVFAPRALGGVFDALGVPVIAATSMTLAGYTRFAPSDTVILTSISGSTKRTVEAARAATVAGARVIAVTCKGDSALARAASETIVLPFEPLSRKTPHTLDYAMTLLALVELARRFAGEPADATRSVIEKIPVLLASAAKSASKAALAHDGRAKLFILGGGPDLGTAEYGAAKFHEAGGLIAIAAETENFAHGMNFMVEPEDTIVALGGSALGHRRGTEVIEAFASWIRNARAYPPLPPPALAWTEVLETVLDQTFFLQHLCLAVSDALGLALEEPRAGRSWGTEHLAIQSRILAT